MMNRDASPLQQFKTIIPIRIKSRLRRLESILQKLRTQIPTRGQILEYSYRKLLRRPMTFRDSHGILYEFGTTESYSKYIDLGTIQDDPAMVRYIMRVVGPGNVVLDVGAHIGSVSLLAGKLAGPTGQVFAFEAESENYQRLLKNIILNDLSSCVLPVHRAVASSEGIVELHIFDRAACGWNTLGWYELNGWTPKTTESVTSVTLDDFCSTNKIGHVDLLKVDVEGAEPDVLAGAKGLLRHGAIKKVIFEVSRFPLQGMSYQVDDILAPLIAGGYTFWKICEDGGLEPVTESEMRETDFANFVALSL